MTESARSATTAALQRATAGDEKAASELMPLVYDELRKIAESYIRRERADHTLQPTALVHEAWVKLIDQPDAAFADRAHFRAIATQAMRRILVDHARGKQASKRDAGGERVTISGVAPEAGDASAGGDSAVDLLGLDAALSKLAEVSPRQARVVELRFFGGLTAEEAAVAMGVSRRTVQGDWRVARAWLQRELDRDATGSDS